MSAVDMTDAQREQFYRGIPKDCQPLVAQVLLHLALKDLLPPTANRQCLELAEETAREFDAWVANRG